MTPPLLRTIADRLRSVPGVRRLARRRPEHHPCDELERQVRVEADRRRSTESELDVVRQRADEMLRDNALLRRADAWAVPASQRTDGVNVVGYVQHQLGLGEDARRLVDVLALGGIPHSIVSHRLSESPVLPTAFPSHQRLDFETTVALMPADQIMLLSRLHPELRRNSRRLIGYCYWELETLSESMRLGARTVDEIWVRSGFVRRAFEELGGTPVRVVPFPVPEPRPAPLGRDDFPILAGAADRPLFGTLFDYFSVMERKNPLGTIEAFERAFRPDEGPVLIVKTLNGDRFPDDHGAVLERAARRPDIIVWDAHLPRAEHDAFIAALDVMVALHRSEGFGLHLAEAMWLGRPVVATRYSGNLDFMDDSNSVLIDHSMIEVAAGGGIYPSGARWADPDLDQAAAALRRLATDPDLRSEIGASARRAMLDQPSPDAVAMQLRELLTLDASASGPAAH